MTTLEKQLSDGSATVSYGAGERPKYGALKRAIDAYYGDLLRPLLGLRETVFTFLQMPRVTKEEEERLQQRQREAVEAWMGPVIDRFIENTKPEYPEVYRRAVVYWLADKAGWQLIKQDEEQFRYLARHRRILDDAISLFLNEMAGPDRTRGGFVEGGMESDTPDGVIQQRNFQTMLTGVERAGDVVGASTTLAFNRQSPAVKAMLDNAFTRLSENGTMRLEGVRDEIHGILVSSTDAGLGPLDVARQLSKQFDAYSSFEFQRLARTESAFAAEAGAREQYREFGVEFVTILTAGNPCPICQAWDGKTVPIEELDSQPPFHPSCLCTTVPVGIEAP